MRKLFCFLLSLIIFPMTVLGQTYELSDLDLKIEIPSSYAVFTVDNYKGNPLLKKYDFEEEGLKKYFDENEIYLYGFNEGVDGIFIYSSFEFGDIRNYSSAQLEEYKIKHGKEIEEGGFTLTRSSIENMNDIPFFMFEYSDKKGIIVDYITLVSNHSILFKFQSYEKSLLEEKRDFISNIMKTASFSHNIIYEKSSQNGYLYVLGTLVIIVVATILIKKYLNKDKCPYCRLKLEKENAFCPRCGNQVKKNT